MKDINRIAIDLAKNVFQVCALNSHSKVLFNKTLKRSKFIEFMAKLPHSKVYIEACYSSHYWGRTLTAMGHVVHLIPAQHVTPFVRGNKSDYNDALAIAEAANRPNIRFVPIKSIQQQEIMEMHRLRERWVRSRTQISNQARGLLSDFGIIFPQGYKGFREAMVNIQHDKTLSLSFRGILNDLYVEFNQTSERISVLEEQLQSYTQQNKHAAIVRSVPGIGLINASALVASIDQGQAFKTPREFGVWLGLTPKQFSSGDKFKRSGITKRGDRYLRTQLIHAARATKKWAKHRTDQLSLWVKQLEKRVGTHKATIAIAHKLARIIWILLKRQTLFVEQYPQQVTVGI